MADLGHKRWAIAEGYIPSGSVSQDPTLLSHETVCLLNTSARDAEIAITLYFEDREPVGPYRLVLGARCGLRICAEDALAQERGISVRHGADGVDKGERGGRVLWA